MKKAILVLVPLLLVSFVLAGPKGPQGPKDPKGPKGDGPIGPPTGLTATVVDDTIECTWTAVAGATKYSLEVCLTGTADDGATEFPIKVKVSVSVPQPELLPAPDPTTVEGTLELAPAIEAALVAAGADPATIISITLNGKVQVKAMNPGKKAGPQNHPWSDPVVVIYEWEAEPE